jgi:hypothetical protein
VLHLCPRLCKWQLKITIIAWLIMMLFSHIRSLYQSMFHFQCVHTWEHAFVWRRNRYIYMRK